MEWQRKVVIKTCCFDLPRKCFSFNCSIKLRGISCFSEVSSFLMKITHDINMCKGRRELVWPFSEVDPDLNQCHNNSYEYKKMNKLRNCSRNHNHNFSGKHGDSSNMKNTVLQQSLFLGCWFFLNTKGMLLHSSHKLDTNSDPCPKNLKNIGHNLSPWELLNYSSF